MLWQRPCPWHLRTEFLARKGCVRHLSLGTMCRSCAAAAKWLQSALLTCLKAEQSAGPRVSSSPAWASFWGWQSSRTPSRRVQHFSSLCLTHICHCQRKSHSQAQSQGERGLIQGERIHQRPLLNHPSERLVCSYPCFSGEETEVQKG